ncbi:MAG: hypothetical protein IJ551_11495 [Prevotella sp.]|nr:hypothetical protein [Prevotella sp.]
MLMTKRKLWWLTLCLLAFPVQAQHLADPFLTKDFEAHVKSIDEFMARFNGTEAFPGLNKEAPDFMLRNLASLFDQKGMSTTQKQQGLKFIQTVTDSQIKLTYADSGWYAMARCDIKFKGRQTHVMLVLHPEKIKAEHYRWVFCGADSIVGNLIDANKKSSISPVEHEIHFMELQSIFRHNSQNIFSYRETSYHIDQLTAFLALVQAGSIEFEQVSDLRFVFTQVPDYVFTVEERGRKGTNAGWLISDVKQKNDIEKKKYINKMLGQ